MNCFNCNVPNEPDARYCRECGKLLTNERQITSAKAAKPYLYIFLLIPVILIAAGLGYYKYFLPQGISAVVNGEKIKRSELDAAFARTKALYGISTGDQDQQEASRLRYHVLNGLITERLALQEALKAGIAVSLEEVRAGVSEAEGSSGMDKEHFQAAVIRDYGTVPAFEEAVRRELTVKKFLEEKIIPKGAGPEAASAAVDKWMQNVYTTASVRVTLSEQWSGAGCGCCGKKTDQEKSPRNYH